MRSSSSAFKLTCELIGAILAKRWCINVPDAAFVKIRISDWPHFSSINFTAPALGSKYISEAVDITSVSYTKIKDSINVCKHLLKIALFDIWVANEDRNFNNSNLLYNLRTDDLIAIDHGCILNTASFDCNLSLLTFNESILQSDLAHRLFKGLKAETLDSLAGNTISNLKDSHYISSKDIDTIIEIIPPEWNIPNILIKEKLEQLYDPGWIEKCNNLFLEIIKDSNYV